MRHRSLNHQFVATLPRSLDAGTLYVSMKYATAAHLCCYGCGAEVVTPFTPTDWKMIFDGDTVSLSPSIGSWGLACRSHYVVDRGRVIEAGPWSDEEIAAEGQRDKRAKARYYGVPEAKQPAELPLSSTPRALTPAGLGLRIIRWVLRLVGGRK